jgi:hypothetical protein
MVNDGKVYFFFFSVCGNWGGAHLLRLTRVVVYLKGSHLAHFKNFIVSFLLLQKSYFTLFFLRHQLTNHPIWLKNWILWSISPLVTTGGVTGTQLVWKLHPLDHHTTQLHTLTTMATLQTLNNLNNYII